MTIHIVKSVGRSLEVMELFADCRDASVMQVARALDYPQSSTSELLQSLAALGYLRYDARRRTFSAGARAALLGAGLSARVFGAGDIGGLVERMAAETRREAHVCDVIGGRVHYLLGSERAGARPPAPLTRSAAGVLFLSAMPDVEAARLAAGQGGSAGQALADRLAQARRDGYSLYTDASCAELAIPLNRQPGLSLTLRGFGGDEQAAPIARRARMIVRRWRTPDSQRQALR